MNTLEQARAEARANSAFVDMVVGWQINDVTGEREYGWCPESHVGPSYVYEVIERFPCQRCALLNRLGLGEK